LIAGAGTRRSKLKLIVAAGAAFLILLGLGTWQLERRAWKLGLIAEREAALAAPPADIAAAGLDPAQAEFGRIQATGRFAHDRELYLTGQFLGSQVGWHVITPLLLTSGGALLVDRGYVPETAKDPAKRAAGQIEGTVTVEGILRQSTPPGWFTPTNQPQQNLWFYRDAAAMAEAAALTGAKPFFLIAGPSPNPGGLPIGTQERVELPNDHLQYAITWYALAAALVVVAFVRLRAPEKSA
jgi:surfeit locus 1 family protein